MDYTGYGLKRLDHISSSTMSASHDLTVNDASQNYKAVWITLSIQVSTNNTTAYGARLLDSSGTERNCISGSIGSGSTTRYGTLTNNPRKDINISHWNASNTSYTSYSGRMGHYIIQMFFDRSTSVPFSRVQGLFQGIGNGGNHNLSRGGFECTDDVAITDIRFFAGSSNITINATSYGIMS